MSATVLRGDYFIGPRGVVETPLQPLMTEAWHAGGEPYRRAVRLNNVMRTILQHLEASITMSVLFHTR